MAKVLVMADNGEVLDKIHIPANFQLDSHAKNYFLKLVEIDIDHALRMDERNNRASELAQNFSVSQKKGKRSND